MPPPMSNTVKILNLSSVFAINVNFSIRMKEKVAQSTGVLPRTFFRGRGKSIIMQISFVTPIFLLFSDQI